jgi:nucleotide-binding universal stress UspA family protein
MEMRIIVATDGEPAAAGAIRMAGALAERHGARVEAVCVVPPFPSPPSRIGGPEFLGSDGLDRAACNAARERVLSQLGAISPGFDAWPMTVTMGTPARAIVRIARDRGATLIVIGQGRHALADRWLGTETALRVVRLAHVPVLAVPADARTLPDRAVAAVDFSDFSRAAVRGALHVLRPGGVLHLTHVFWRPSEEIPWVGGRDWVEARRQQLRAELEQMVRDMDGTAGIQVRAELLEGDPATATLHLARSVGAEMIAAGSHGAGFLGRILMGSVSTRLVRGAPCMVLIAPPSDVPAELEPHTQPEAVSARAGDVPAVPLP